jgi:hypothetical protein
MRSCSDAYLILVARMSKNTTFTTLQEFAQGSARQSNLVATFVAVRVMPRVLLVWCC